MVDDMEIFWRQRIQTALSKELAVKVAEIERLKAELAPPGNPQRDTRTRVEDGLPNESFNMKCFLVWNEDPEYDHVTPAYWDSVLNSFMFATNSPIKAVTHYRIIDLSPFAPTPEPTYTVAKDGMPKEDGWCWKLDPFPGSSWIPNYIKHSSIQVDWALNARYQRIRQPEEPK